MTAGYNPVARLAQLSQEFAPNANGGPFDTGLASNDFAGYVQRLKDQQEYEGLKAQQQGKELSVRTLQNPNDPYAVSQATGRDQSETMGLPAWVGGAEWEGLKRAAAARGKSTLGVE